MARPLAAFTKPGKPQGRGLEVRETRLDTFCGSQGIPLFKPDKASTPENEKILSDLAPDLLFVIAFGQILRPSFYQIPKYGAFNLHFSLLPKYRGASPITSAILDGREEIGLTIQKINEKMDEGDVALQSVFPIQGLRAPAVFEKSVRESIPLLESFFSGAPGTFTNLKKQNAAEATYCTKTQKESGRISPDSHLVQVERMLRAYDPWPGIFLDAEGKRYRILELGEKKVSTEKEYGFVERTDKWELSLVLPDGRASIEKIQPEGKRAMPARDFLNAQPAGFRWKIV